MIRHEDGTLFTFEEIEEFEIELGKLFRDKDFLEKMKITEDDYTGASRLLFLMRNNTKEFKHNEVTRIYKNIKHRRYLKNRREEDTSGLTKYEKQLKTITRKKYLNVQKGESKKKHYNKRAILYRAAHNLINAGLLTEKQKENPKHFIKLVKQLEQKYGHIIKNEMNNIRVGYTNFIKTRHVMAFKQRFSHPIFEGKIDFERLFKYLSATTKIRSNEEDMKWLAGLLTIVLRTGIEVRREDKFDAEKAKILRELLDAETRKMIEDIEDDILPDESVLLRYLDPADLE